MQLHPDFTHQSENQQMTQGFYNYWDPQESVFLPKTPKTLVSTHYWPTPLFSYPFNQLSPFLEAADSGCSAPTEPVSSPQRTHGGLQYNLMFPSHLLYHLTRLGCVLYSRNHHKSCSKIISGLLNTVTFYFHLD